MQESLHEKVRSTPFLAGIGSGILRGAEKLKMRFWTNSESIAGIRRFSGQLWLLLLIHTLFNERGFAVSVNFSLYVRRIFEVSSDSEIAVYYTVWRLCGHAIRIVSGFVVEMMGLRRALIMGCIVMTVGQILFSMSSYLWLTLGSLFWLITLGSVFFEQAADLLPLYYFRDRPTTTIVFSAMYASMNLGALASLVVTYISLKVFDGWGGYRVMMSIAAMVSVIGSLSSIFYNTPDLLLEAQDTRPRASFSTVFKVFLERQFWQLFALLFSMTGVWSIYRFVDLMLIIYLVRIEPSISYAPLLAINTILIIPLVSACGVLTNRGLTPYTWIVIGVGISATSLVWLWLIPGSPIFPTVLMMIQVTIGEAISAPKIQEWVSSYSPEGKKAIYKGWLPLAQAPGEFFVGILSSALLTRYCPEQTFTLELDNTDATNSADEVYLNVARTMWLWTMLFALSSLVLLLVLRPFITYEPKPKHIRNEIEMEPATKGPAFIDEPEPS